MGLFKRKKRIWYRDEYKRINTVAATVGLVAGLLAIGLVFYGTPLPAALLGWLFLGLVFAFAIATTIAIVVRWVDSHEREDWLVKNGYKGTFVETMD